MALALAKKRRDAKRGSTIEKKHQFTRTGGNAFGGEKLLSLVTTGQEVLFAGGREGRNHQEGGRDECAR